MSRRTLIQHLAFVITVDERDRVLHDAAIVVHDDRIEAVGLTEEVRAALPPEGADTVLDGRRLGAVPGFVDTHVHLSETLSRASFPDNLTTRPWVFHWVMPYYGHMSAEDEAVSVTLAALEMVQAGTTCFLDMGALRDPASTIPTIARVGIRGVTGRHAADVRPTEAPPGWTEEMMQGHFFPNADAALEVLEQTVRDWNGYADGRIRCWVNIQGKEPCSADLHLGARTLAERLGVGTTYHIASTAEESENVERRYGRTPVARIASLGGLGNNLVLAHAVAVAESEIAMLAEQGTKVAFCPGASMKLAKGAAVIGKYPEMMESGVTVGLGTDGVSASGNLSLMRQIHLVAGMFKDSRRDPDMIGARRALRMATIDGARALLWDDEIGSLEPGKKADFVLFDLDHPQWVPCEDPVQALVWSATPSSIAETWIDGRPVYRRGTFEAMPDTASLFEEARERAAALVRRAGLDQPDVPVTTTLYNN